MIDYYLITKPGILIGNLIAVTGGFLLASKGAFPPFLFLFTFIGIALIMASSCVFNNLIDLSIDSKMERTKNRPLVLGKISKRQALFYATFLGLSGFFLLLTFTTFTAAGVALLGFIDYVLLYSFLKKKTVYGTAIGSFAGAVPPVVGYTAVTGQIDLCALILFAILVLWQMPHFYAIALLNAKDYQKAGLPLLPFRKGVFKTKVHISLYIVGFILACSFLTFSHYTGMTFLIISCLLGLAWLSLSLRGFTQTREKAWERQMFQFSLVVITALFLVMPFDLTV